MRRTTEIIGYEIGKLLKKTIFSEGETREDRRHINEKRFKNYKI